MFEVNVTNYTLNGKCSNCGECCSNFLPLSDEEKVRIHQYVKQNNIKEQVHNFPQSGATIDMTCPFRSRSSRKCLIYKVRPAICRSFICNKTPEQILSNRDFYYKQRSVVDMRSEFFGKYSILGNPSLMIGTDRYVEYVDLLARWSKGEFNRC